MLHTIKQKHTMDEVFDYRIPRLIKIRFAESDCRLCSDKYEAEFLDGLPAPPPLYDDIECIKNGRYIKCRRNASEPFYSWFVPAKDDGMPLMVVIPGYEAQLKSYPDVSDKYNLLFISPLGYSTPGGINYDKVFNGGTFPVLYNTLCGFENSYKDWLLDALTVIKFIEDKNLADTDKLIFAGTSHGGGMAMVLASYYGKERCMAVCADLPYLIGFSTNRFFDLLYEYSPPIDIRFRASEAKKRLSLVDPEWHASRLKMPVLITSSDIDEDCPEEDIENLYDMIPDTTPKTYIKYNGRPHGYSSEFFKDMMSFLGEMKEVGYF